MSILINRSLLDQTTFSSTSPSGLACVIHTVAHEGEHELQVLGEAETHAETVPMTIGRQEPGGATPVARLEVNPTALGAARRKRGASEPPVHQILQPGAHLWINTPVPQDARRVRLVRKADDAVVFDTASLGAGDRFAVTLVRPGRYQVENQLDGSKLMLMVESPVTGKLPYRPPPPMQIACTAAGFEAPTPLVKPLQGLIFVCSAPARLHLDLCEPDDGSPSEAGPGSRPPVPDRRDGPTDEPRPILHRVRRTFRATREDG
jgi:hypothetical protein